MLYLLVGVVSGVFFFWGGGNGVTFEGGVRGGWGMGWDVHADMIAMIGFNAFDDDAWILRLVGFIREVLQQRRVKIVGVCFGHQIVGRALGAKVGRSKEWEVSVCEVSQTERGKEVFGGGEVLVWFFLFFLFS